MVYPNVSTAVSVPVGTPSGSLFVDVSETFGKGLKDLATGRLVPIEDCARGYWNDANLASAHATKCQWLIARVKGVIRGIWRIDTKQGWKSASISPCISTRRFLHKSFCELIPVEDKEMLMGLLNKHVHLGKSLNPLRGYFVFLLIIASVTCFCGCDRGTLQQTPDAVAKKVMRFIVEGKIGDAKDYCTERGASMLSFYTMMGVEFTEADWHYKRTLVRNDRAVVRFTSDHGIEFSDKSNGIEFALELSQGKWKYAAYLDNESQGREWLWSKKDKSNAFAQKYGPDVGDVEICFEYNTNELKSISPIQRSKAEELGPKMNWDFLSRKFLLGILKNNSSLYHALITDAWVVVGRMPEHEEFSLREDTNGRYVLTVKGVDLIDKTLIQKRCKARGLVQVMTNDGHVFLDNQVQPLMIKHYQIPGSLYVDVRDTIHRYTIYKLGG